ncbi:transposase [Salinibius halmophilus]|uniref:transposase n=1 Tax=Salinibius halmophilus TaxID=1853216 RepID=UPI000E668809|nr:transposase [Salinibius halmophilus]
MTVSRESQISLPDTSAYHIFMRSVRQTSICGVDPFTHRSYEHRKEWIISRIEQLVRSFCIGVAAYAIMPNHYHLVVIVDKNTAEQLTDNEVVARWGAIYKVPHAVKAYIEGDAAFQHVAQPIIATWRERLFDISWFMRSLNEYIARKCNAEDGCVGRFWEGRFKCQAVLDERALLAVMAYVDLNPIRAKLATHIYDSSYTSAYERLHGGSIPNQNRECSPWLLPFDSEHLPFKEVAYMELLEWTGRQIRTDKPGFIDPKLPWLTQLYQFTQGGWVDVCQSLEQRIHGAIGAVAKVVQYRKHCGYVRRRPSKVAIALFP